VNVKVIKGKYYHQQLNKAYSYILECYKKDVLQSDSYKKK